MTVQHAGAAIAIWVVCAVLLVVVVCLTVFLFCRRHRRRLARRRRLEQIKINVDEHGVSSTGAAINANPVAGAAALYIGFHRSTAEELEALPPPNSAWSFPAPLVVHLRVRPDQAVADACDVLVSVDRLRDSVATDHCSSQVLGNDGFYHNDFLLYANPLEFTEAGTYMIQAHTVHPTRKVVGAVHQFVYVVTATPSAGFNALAGGGGGGANANLIDIDIARRQLARAQAEANAFQAAAPASALSATVAPPSTAGAAPLPPTIWPSSGEVTTSTEVVISPHELSTSPDQLRYSVDGSYPSLLYTGPIKLSLPPPSLLPSQRRQVIVHAIAVRADGGGVSAAARAGLGTGVSATARAVLQVRPAGLSYFDPSVPTPSMRLRASDATLYFDESQNPPHTQTLYEVVYVEEARRKVKFNRHRARLYDGNPIVLPENVATVHAWTVMRSDAADREGAAPEEACERVRSMPCIYDCSRAAAERGKLSRRRLEQYNIRPDQLLPPPVMCVSCGEMELAFDDAPANGRIAYTLNGTEPALCDVTPPACAVPLGSDAVVAVSGAARSGAGGVGSSGRHDHVSPVVGDRDGSHTYLYQPGKHIHVTLMETQQVFVTARAFLPIFEGSDGALYGDHGAQGGNCLGSGRLLGYRYGGVFHRGFYFHNT